MDQKMSEAISMDVRALLARQQLLNQHQHKRLGRKIHDKISQKMTMLALQLSLAATKGEEPADWEKNCKEWADLVMDLGQSIRDISNDLQPRVQDDIGLKTAFRWLRQSLSKNIACNLIEPAGTISMPLFAANELFTICRDIVADILVPAKVAEVDIELSEKDGIVFVQVCSDDTADGKQSITVAALDALAVPERLQCLDGAGQLKHSLDCGSVLTLSVPIDVTAACAAC
jgi:signal transduction histidine kinase